MPHLILSGEEQLARLIADQFTAIGDGLSRLETTQGEIMSALTDKLDRLAAAIEADNINDAAALAEVVRTRDEAVAARDAALANDAADAQTIADLQNDVAAANAKLDELLAQFPAPSEPAPETPAEPQPEPPVDQPNEEPAPADPTPVEPAPEQPVEEPVTEPAPAEEPTAEPVAEEPAPAEPTDNSGVSW